MFFLSIFVAMKKRNHAFDFLCGICIIRMVTLHIMSFCGHADDEWWREVMQWTYFFMSFFFFKAGYFNKTVAGDSKAYLIDKSKHLLVPYLTCGSIGFLIYMAFQPFLIHAAYFQDFRILFELHLIGNFLRTHAAGGKRSTLDSLRPGNIEPFF